MTVATPVVFYEYAATDDKWQPHNAVDNNRTGKNVVSHRLSLMTWNIWYEPVEDKLRFQGILNQIYRVTQEVDVIALQEVTPRFLAALQSNQYIQQHWLITDRWDDAHQKVLRDNGYGVMFLVNRALEINIEAWIAPFPTSKTGRYAQLLEMKTDDLNLVIFHYPDFIDERHD